MVGADRRQWRGKIDAVTSNGRSSYAHSRYGYAATTGDEKPENVVLLEIFPEQQKTAIDFVFTEQYLGVKTICLTKVKKEGKCISK